MNGNQEKARSKIALIIDDSDINRDILSIYLKELNYQIVTAKDGEEGYFRFQSFRPNIVLLDIVIFPVIPSR